MAGKHVWVEKPITLNSTAAYELELARKQDLVLSVGHILWFISSALIIELLNKGVRSKKSL